MINSKYVTELKNTIKEFMDYRIKVKSYVCIDEMVIKPVAQAAPYKVFRKA